MQPPDVPKTFRFGDFELDVAGYSLRRGGQQVRLERRPMDLLILLVQRRRELVSRNDIVERLWGPGVFVDVDMGVNTAIRKIRQVLGDAPETPAFVETVSGKGYRFIAAVEAVQPAAAPSASRAVTLAVLPFENLGGTPEHDYIADGFTEEATTALGQIDPEHLSVIGRTSVMGYKRTTKSLADIGRELGATYVIEGSIRAEGQRWRVTSKLIRVRDQVQTWSASFDSEPSSMLEFQRELSQAIAEPIRLRLSPERLTALGRRQSRSPEAYDLYLRGRHLWNQLTPPTNRRAVEHFARATELDPEYRSHGPDWQTPFRRARSTRTHGRSMYGRGLGMPLHMRSAAVLTSRRVKRRREWSITGSTGTGRGRKRPTERPSFWIRVAPTRTACWACCSAPPVAMLRRAQRCNMPESSIHYNR